MERSFSNGNGRSEYYGSNGNGYSAQTVCQTKYKKVPECVETEKCKTWSITDSSLWIGGLIIAFLIWIMLWNSSPEWALSPDGSVDLFKTAITSIIAAVVLIILVCLFRNSL